MFRNTSGVTYVVSWSHISGRHLYALRLTFESLLIYTHKLQQTRVITYCIFDTFISLQKFIGHFGHVYDVISTEILP